MNTIFYEKMKNTTENALMEWFSMQTLAQFNESDILHKS